MAGIALAGILIQLLGLSIAMKGVRDAYRSVVGTAGDPIGAVMARMVWRGVDSRRHRLVRGLVSSGPVAFLRQRLGKPPPPPVATTPSGVVTQTVPGTATITTGPAPVGLDAPLGEQVAYLRERVDQLEHTASIERDRWRQAVKNTNKTLGARIDEASKRIEQTDQDVSTVRKATIGTDGRALAETFGGLAVTAMGVALTIAGLPGMPWSIPSG